MQRSVKSVRRQSVPTTLIEFQGCERGFAPHRTRRYGQPHALFAALGAAALSRTHHSQHGLHGVVAAFTFSVFSSIFVPAY